MSRQHFLPLLGAIIASSLIVASCTDDSLMHPEEPAAAADPAATTSTGLNPLNAALGTGQCMGNDAVDAGIVSGFKDDPLAFNCTANDVRIANARTSSGLPIQCVAGQPITPPVDIVADIVETSTSVRHDIGIWIENGDNGAGGAEDGQCDFFYFDEADITAEGGVVDGDGDQCGDMENAGTVNDFELGDLDLVCPENPVVVDGKTFIEIASCVSWTQPGGDRVCPIPGEVAPNGPRFGTLPANKAKCNCEPFLVEVEILAQLTLLKTVVNDNGGTAVDTDWTLQAMSSATTISGAEGDAAITNASVQAGAYTLSESGGPSGYTPSNWVCTGDGSLVGDVITLDSGDSATCTIKNDDISPTLKLVKTVVNDDGGTAVATDFQAKIDGNNVAWDVAQDVDAGAHTASETMVAGYTAGSWGGDCAADGTITLALDQDATCTITNDDQPATLTLVKTVVNNDGGTAVANDFQAKIDGVDVPWNAPQAVDPGTRTASETVVPGYSAGSWGGDCNADGTVLIALGDAKTCTITNDDIAPTLTLVKTVVNNDGGTAVATDFQAKIDGSNVPWSVKQTVDAGAHTASETMVAGYTAGSWGGDCAADGTITLALDQDATCTITNDDIPQGCEAGDRLTSVSLQLTANSPNPITIGVTDDNGPNPSLLASSPGLISTGTTFTIVPDGGATFFDHQNLRFFLDGAFSKNLKVHLSCSDDPMVGDTHSGTADGASATLTKTGFTPTQFP